MLVLSRRPDERIIIGEGLIEVQVIEIRRDHVRLGVTAPPGMRIDREEIHQQRMLNKVKENLNDPDVEDLADITAKAF